MNVFSQLFHYFSTCHTMADEGRGDEVGGWDAKMKEELKSRMEKRKRRQSRGDVPAGEPHQPPLLSDVPAGEPPLLGDSAQPPQTPRLEKRQRHHSAGKEVAELSGGGDALDAELPPHPLHSPQLEVESSSESESGSESDEIARDKIIDEIARRVG